MPRFQNRKQAGMLLAHKLKEYALRRPLVLALPRGGIPLAKEIADTLKAPLDILAVKKIGAPGNPEFAVGAVSEDGVPVLDEDTITKFSLDREEIIHESERKAAEMREQLELFRKHLPIRPAAGHDVILVDDGIATGATMEAALQVLRRRDAARIFVAAPVCSGEAADRMKRIADGTVILFIPEFFRSVGAWYEDFHQVEDQEALALLGIGKQTGIASVYRESVEIRVGAEIVEGDLAVPDRAKLMVIFSHGSGSSRKSRRNRFVAESLQQAGIATLLFDLLTTQESWNRANVFNIDLLAERLSQATDWARARFPDLKLAYFGASTGAAAALQAAAKRPADLMAVVSRGGRPDLAKGLHNVKAPVLLIVGGADMMVLRLNEEARKQIPQARLTVIPGAGHLFEEEGKLEDVVEYSLEWLLRSASGGKKKIVKEPEAEIVREIVAAGNDLDSDDDLRVLAGKLAHARVVMLGESSHGTRDFYEIRRKLSRILIDEHGFGTVAVEGDWPDCFSLNEYVNMRAGKSAKAVMEEFKRWPTWMWANEEVRIFTEQIRGHGVGFYGLDVYSLYESVEVIRRYCGRLDPDLAEEIMGNYACFEPFAHDEIAYAKSLLRFPEGCRREAAESLRSFLSDRLRENGVSRHEIFDLQQNARVIKNAENYYRSMLDGGAESWNVRDRHMLETLMVLLERSDKKVIVWAHNTHIGDYRATDMLDEGYINLGGLAREEFGGNNVALVGFGTNSGEVLASPAWGAKEEVMPLPSAPDGTYENYFHRASLESGRTRFFLDLKSAKGNGSSALSRNLGHRAVGVVYDYKREKRNYVPTRLSERYDVFVYVDHTEALVPLHIKPEPGLFPETWPLGL